MNKLRRPSLCPKVPCFRRHLTTTANNQTFQGRKSMHPTTCLTFFLSAAMLTDFRPPIVIPAWEGSRRSETGDSSQSARERLFGSYSLRPIGEKSFLLKLNLDRTIASQNHDQGAARNRSQLVAPKNRRWIAR